MSAATNMLITIWAKQASRIVFGMLAGFGLATALDDSNAQARPQATPHEVPADWLRYANSVQEAVGSWLGEDSETATRFRSYLAAIPSSRGSASYEVQLKVWIDGNGIVDRIEFPSFGDATADSDLRALIVGRKLSTMPPQAMLQPLRLAIAVDLGEAPPPSLPAASEPTA